MKKAELKDFLDQKAEQYEHPNFIEHDPIWIPHQYELKEDVEIMAFLISILAWGQRITIINNGKLLGELFGHQPYEAIKSRDFSGHPLVEAFKHRTFNGIDLDFFIRSIKHIYQEHGGLEMAFSRGSNSLERIEHFRSLFLETEHQDRSEKHLASPAKGSSAKRLNMFLRWMVRSSSKGVDFGLWSSIKPSELLPPLDVHTARTARQLGLLKRNQNDWRSVEELGNKLRELDPNDPVKYDFALFGLGVNGEL